MDKKKTKSVLLTPEIHLELKQMQVVFLEEGSEKTMLEIIGEGLKALREAKAKKQA